MSSAHKGLIAKLIDQFPSAFSTNPQPLKIGIGNDIAKALDIDPRSVALALGYYCNLSAYLSACRKGATRVDLDGNPAGTVTEAEATHAEKRLGEIGAVWRSKREARLAHARELEAKDQQRPIQAEAEHKTPRRRQAEAAHSGLRREPRKTTVTRTKPTVVVRLGRPRSFLRP